MDIYILQLENGKYYVGRSVNLKSRLKSHFDGKGSVWTRQYRPIRVMKTVRVTSPFDEDKYVKEMMAQHGIDNVRGGSYSRLELTDQDRVLLKKEIYGALDLCFICGKTGHFVTECRQKQKGHTNKTSVILHRRKSKQPEKTKATSSQCAIM